METSAVFDLIFKLVLMALGVFISLFASLLKRTVNEMSDKISKIELDSDTVKDSILKTERELTHSINEMKILVATIAERNTADKERLQTLEKRVTILENKIK